MVIVRAGVSNPLAIMDKLSYQQVLEWFMYNKERSAIECDKATRETGLLTKMVVVIDLNHTSWSGNDGGFSKANGESSTLGEFLYPQLLKCTVMINVPSTFRLFFPVRPRGLPPPLCLGYVPRIDPRVTGAQNVLLGKDAGEAQSLPCQNHERRGGDLRLPSRLCDGGTGPVANLPRGLVPPHHQWDSE